MFWLYFHVRDCTERTKNRRPREHTGADKGFHGGRLCKGDIADATRNHEPDIWGRRQRDGETILWDEISKLPLSVVMKHAVYKF